MSFITLTIFALQRFIALKESDETPSLLKIYLFICKHCDIAPIYLYIKFFLVRIERKLFSFQHSERLALLLVAVAVAVNYIIRKNKHSLVIVFEEKRSILKTLCHYFMSCFELTFSLCVKSKGLILDRKSG